MKIESNVHKNFWLILNEARGVAIHKRKIIKKGKCSHINYFEEVLIIFFLLLLLAVATTFFPIFAINVYGIFVLILAFLYLIINISFFLITYSYREKQHFKSFVLLTKEGLVDESYHQIKMLFKWDLIQAIVIKKYSITILTKTPCYFYFGKESEKDILKALKKYHQKILVIKE